MIFYFIIFAILWIGFALQVAKAGAVSSIDAIALLVFVIVAGQRFETGNDWLIYRDHYIAMQDYLTWGSGQLADFPDFEPLYVLTVWLCGVFFDFQSFLLLVALFNGVVLFQFCRFWKASFVGVSAIYYAWLYLGTQMATIRYSLAMSFLLWATMCVMSRRRWTAVGLFLVAAGYHLSVLAFAPLFVFFARKLTVKWVLIIIGLSYFLIRFLLFVVSSGVLDGVPFLDKLALYLDVATIPQLSWASYGYIGINLTFFAFVFFFGKDDPRWRVAQWGVFYLLLLEIVLWNIPIFWVRAQVFVVVIQACILVSSIVSHKSVTCVVVLACISFAVLYRTIDDPAFISYVPYQSYWMNELLLGDAAQDGEIRFYEAIERSKVRGKE